MHHGQKMEVKRLLRSVFGQNSIQVGLISSVRSSNSHPDLLLTHHQQHPLFHYITLTFTF